MAIFYEFLFYMFYQNQQDEYEFSLISLGFSLFFTIFQDIVLNFLNANIMSITCFVKKISGLAELGVPEVHVHPYFWGTKGQNPHWNLPLFVAHKCSASPNLSTLRQPWIYIQHTMHFFKKFLKRNHKKQSKISSKFIPLCTFFFYLLSFSSFSWIFLISYNFFFSSFWMTVVEEAQLSTKFSLVS